MVKALAHAPSPACNLSQRLPKARHRSLPRSFRRCLQGRPPNVSVGVRQIALHTLLHYIYRIFSFYIKSTLTLKPTHRNAKKTKITLNNIKNAI